MKLWVVPGSNPGWAQIFAFLACIQKAMMVCITSTAKASIT